MEYNECSYTECLKMMVHIETNTLILSSKTMYI